MNTPLRPQTGINLVSTYIREEGTFPHTKFITVMNYDDGSQREFDGKEWKVTIPSLQFLERECQFLRDRIEHNDIPSIENTDEMMKGSE